MIVRSAVWLLAILVLPLLLGATTAQEEPALWIWSGGDAPKALATTESLGLDFWHYQHLDMVLLWSTESQAQTMALEASGRITPNEVMSLDLDRSVEKIEADLVKEEVGYMRNGPSVIIIDTGIDSLHPDFQNGNLVRNVAAARTGTGLVRGILEPDVIIDEAGHGTHVGGIVAGSAESLGSDDRYYGRFEGVYSNGRIIGYQALAQDTDEPSVDTAAALAGFDFALANQAQYKIRVVQNSWGLPGPFDASHPINEATLELYLSGMNVVFSAGNRGYETNALNRHCLAPWVLCVAAVDRDGAHLPESSVGPTGAGAPAYAHPDIAAPGDGIGAPASTASLDLAGTVTNLLTLVPSNQLYEIRTGTSMAAPHVSGVAALILAANAQLSPDQVMDIIVESAIPLDEPVSEVGAGLVNARKAYNLAVQTTGNRVAFEAGDQVKYAGARSGDPTNSADSITVGLANAPTGGPLLAAPSEGRDVNEIIVYSAFGLGALLVIGLLVAIVVAIVRR